MFLLAHTGITLGAVWLIGHLDKDGVPGLNVAAAIPLGILGSNLPDIIDKPIGIFAPGLGLGTGRGIAHTLAFNVMLLALGLWLSVCGWVGLLYVALASTGHLVLDYMWQLPGVLFWPLLGVSFPKGRRKGFRSQFAAWWNTLWTDPRVYLTEVAGAVFILAYVLQSYRTWL